MFLLNSVVSDKEMIALETCLSINCTLLCAVYIGARSKTWEKYGCKKTWRSVSRAVRIVTGDANFFYIDSTNLILSSRRWRKLAMFVLSTNRLIMLFVVFCGLSTNESLGSFPAEEILNASELS